MRGVVLGTLGQTTTLKAAVDGLKVDGPVALVTAGWQEYEPQDEELPAQLGRETFNLGLYARAEKVFLEDKELQTAHRAMQDRLRVGQEYYRIRVRRMAEALLDIARRSAGTSLEADESRMSMEYLRAIDRDHIERTRQQRLEFEERMKPLERDAVVRHRKEIKKLMSGTKILAIAGGHVAVLLNRLRLFGIPELVGDRVLVAWGGGAMVTAERVLLFHDDPPQGTGVSELLEHGLGFHSGIIALPSPRHRLALHDPGRVGPLAQRHAPNKCVALDNGGYAYFDAAGWFNATGTHWLRPDGTHTPEWCENHWPPGRSTDRGGK